MLDVGKGFHLELNGKQYNFSQAHRGPPELYLIHGYSTSVSYILTTTESC